MLSVIVLGAMISVIEPGLMISVIESTPSAVGLET
jgi:hypothetical protein